MVCALCKISAPTEQIGVSVATNAVTDSTLGEVTVELRDVRKTFGTNEVLHGINLTVSEANMSCCLALQALGSLRFCDQSIF